VSVLDNQNKHLEVIVDDSQLSLAIGKKGQNVRLAAKLLGWKIDIKSEEEKRQEVEQQMSALVQQPATPLENVPGLGEGLVEKLSAAGITTVEALADMTPEQLEAIEGIGPKTVEKISLAVNNYFSSLEGGEAAVAPAEGEEAAEASAEEAVGEGAVSEVPADSEIQEAAQASEEAEPGSVGDIAAEAESGEEKDSAEPKQ
jgi:N utilization substance protein A